MREARLPFVTTALMVMLSAAALAGQAEPPAGDSPADPVAGHPAPVAIERWFDVQAATLTARYRRVESSEGLVNATHLQDGPTLRVRVKFDRKARYTLNAAVATGPGFTAGLFR